MRLFDSKKISGRLFLTGIRDPRTRLARDRTSILPLRRFVDTEPSNVSFRRRWRQVEMLRETVAFSALSS